MIIIWDRKQNEVVDNEGRAWVNAEGTYVPIPPTPTPPVPGLAGLSSGILVFKNGDVGIGNDATFFVKYFRWVRATTVGHLCSVKNVSGDIIYESEADGAKFIDVQPFYKFTHGLRISTLDSGTLYMYLA